MESEERLTKEQASMYRALVARGNYLSQDRSDIQFAVKELSRTMSNPTVTCWEKLKRLARYLIGRTRTVQTFSYQEEPTRITVYTDSDFAGCQRTRKSTSGGVIMYGKAMIKSWSSNQNVIALSSGESDYYAMVKGASHGIGTRHLLQDLGVAAIECIQIASDASAAIGIASRRGKGKVRHIEVNQLWVQGLIMEGKAEVIKIPTTGNAADALTTHLDWGGY